MTETSDRVRRRLERAMAPVFAQMERERAELEAERVRKDPKKHKLTRLFPAGVDPERRHRGFDAGTGPNGRRVWFVYSTARNAAGYFLTWRQTEHPDGRVVRERWCAHKLRRAAKHFARRCWEDFAHPGEVGRP